MKLVALTILAACTAATGAQAQNAAADPVSSASAIATPYTDAHVSRARQRAMARPLPSAAHDGVSAPILLRVQPMLKLRQRFDHADADGSGTLNREEARQAGFTVVEKNFENIDTAQRGQVSFDDLNAYLVQRREEARSR